MLKHIHTKFIRHTCSIQTAALGMMSCSFPQKKFI